MRSPVRFLASQMAKRVIMRAASVMREGELTAVFPGGKRRIFGTPGATPKATLRIHDDEFFSRVLLHGEIGVGEAYVDGLWDSDDLVALMELGVANRRHVQFSSTWVSRASKLKNVRLHRGRRNTQAQAKDNIHAHYDLSNDLFRLFLDETMTYSCAYFSSPEQPLADAQHNKYRMLCERAGIKRGDHVLEIGSGWGGFAMSAAERFGCRVTSVTISEEQLALARERVEQAGLSERVDIRFCDYRDIEGQYDAIVSIEMFEAVGAEYFETFFRVCDRALKPGGRMALQTISLPDRAFVPVRDGVNWVQKYIFPGGMLPSISEIERALHHTDLVIDGLEDIGAHYALTLHQWRERFVSRSSEVRALGFDTRFIRMWEYYLAVCEAGFLTRNTGDLQLGFVKLPSRAELPSAVASANGVAAVEEASRIVAS